MSIRRHGAPAWEAGWGWRRVPGDMGAGRPGKVPTLGWGGGGGGRIAYQTGRSQGGQEER